MKLVLHSIAALAFTAPAFPIQSPVVPAYQPPTKGIPPGTQPLVLFVGSDNCSSPNVIGGPGPHNFNNVSATTDGCPNCQPCGLIQRDVWFTWTPPFTATWTVSLCGLTSGMDPVVAVYNGNTCPAAPAIACNDDFCALISEASFLGTMGSNLVIQVGSFNTTAGGSGSFSFTSAPTPPNDNCSTPTVIAGPGPHAFDNTSATTGVQGQTEGACLAFGSTTIDRDLWYTWTAGSNGIASLTTCSQTAVDTKIAVYPGSGCPVLAAVGCNDDACGFQSAVCFKVTTGQVFTIQLGSFPGASGGPGTFTVTISPPPPGCQHDDGATENIFGWFAGGELAWMQRFGGNGSTGVSNIRVTWGSAAFPGLSPGNGTPSKVAIWDDPNDDGNPSDAVLIQLVNTTVQLVDTDTFITVPITSVVVNGTFFLGAGLAHSAGQFVAPMDQSCPIAGLAWYFGNNNATPVDYANVQNNVFPPQSLALSGFPGIWMVRGTCNAFPGATFCEPGVGGVMACPCGNPPSGPGRGCNNSAATGGATLTDVGTASLAADTVVFTTTGERPTSLSIVLQGTVPINAGVQYGDGVRCVGGALKRLYSKNAVGGSITAPTGLELPVHLRSAALGDTIAPGTNRYYMVYYRDPLLFGCPTPGLSTFNTTSGRWVRWDP